MGQYYVIANVDKREYFSPWDLDGGAKLMEFSWNGNGVVIALTNLLQGDWKGDRVYVVGDYADAKGFDVSSKTWRKTYDSLAKELGFAGKIADKENQFITEGYPITLYAYIKEHFDHRAEDLEHRYVRRGIRYLINKKRKEFVDLANCPLSGRGKVDFDTGRGKPYCMSISPLMLLLAMGNGRGGGDYSNEENMHLVGDWVSTSEHIILTESKFGENLDEMEEVFPNFVERW